MKLEIRFVGKTPDEIADALESVVDEIRRKVFQGNGRDDFYAKNKNLVEADWDWTLSETVSPEIDGIAIHDPFNPCKYCYVAVQTDGETCQSCPNKHLRSVT